MIAKTACTCVYQLGTQNRAPQSYLLWLRSYCLPKMDFSSFWETKGLQFRQMFYLVTPQETMFPSLETVPPMLDEAVPWFLFLIALEVVYFWKKGRKDVFNLSDSMTSMGAGFLQMIMTVAFRVAELSMYCWVHENWCIYQMAWDSPWTWFASFIAVDFAYYWFHRAGHEVNVFWAMHQMHHSSEYYNLTTALRQGMFQQYASMFFYLPEAFFVPPQVHLAHSILSLLYQFWIHTQVIGSLGPLEKIINTPASHRVHHGRNRYCIDKNYGGVFIIWDRMFGTYQPELDSEPISYGLVFPVNSFDAFYCQLFYLKYALWDKPRSMEGIGNKLKAVFYGPGWHPGTDRCGDLAEIPEIDYFIKPYDTGVQAWVSVYTLVHGIFVLLGYQMIAGRILLFPWTIRFPFAATMFFSMQVLSYLLEKKKYVPVLEVIRCLILYLYCCPLIWSADSTGFVVSRLFLVASAAIWIPAAVSLLCSEIGKIGIAVFKDSRVATD